MSPMSRVILPDNRKGNQTMNIIDHILNGLKRKACGQPQQITNTLQNKHGHITTEELKVPTFMRRADLVEATNVAIQRAKLTGKDC